MKLIDSFGRLNAYFIKLNAWTIIEIESPNLQIEIHF